ncbi:MAG: peptidylprolyl isomerase [SAR86 cluster bacterium]|uniref:Peptidyl-prolyl cis-trans isomerase n=1 Tax=SAR86 cluster bacterium TaxID=2030880 RepID=A0A2A4MGI0_9GAMM|nr:MAG: peptidylprolyl isomerase [SAR86 cluster bacterium]
MFSLMMLFTLLTSTAYAGSVVRVETPLGEFSIELFDEVTPLTVANFLNYVNSSRYDGTVIHRSVPGFVIQGGWLSFDEQAYKFTEIVKDANVVNEFNVSNLRGTIAMAKLGDDPNSASSQWFINLVDNEFLDSQNGGFTVFGQVLGDGMEVVDAIAALPIVAFIEAGVFPVIDYNGVQLFNTNLVTMQMSLVEDNAAANVFDESTGLITIKVDGGEAGLAQLSLSIVASDPDVIVQVQLDSVEVLTATVEKMASFDGASGQLVLPELVINGQVAFSELVFELIDAELLQFKLLSFVETP